MVSSLVVIFVAIEMIILPFVAQFWLWAEPLVAGAWMGLAVKSDGGAIASGAITDALIRAKAMDMTGVQYAEGWITMTATTVKMFIDIFIGLWGFPAGDPLVHQDRMQGRSESTRRRNLGIAFPSSSSAMDSPS